MWKKLPENKKQNRISSPEKLIKVDKTTIHNPQDIGKELEKLLLSQN